MIHKARFLLLITLIFPPLLRAETRILPGLFEAAERAHFAENNTFSADIDELGLNFEGSAATIYGFPRSCKGKITNTFDYYRLYPEVGKISKDLLAQQKNIVTELGRKPCFDLKHSVKIYYFWVEKNQLRSDFILVKK